MSTVNIFELRQRFRKSVEYLWRYRIFAGTVYRLKVKKFQILSMRKNFNLSIAKVKYLRSWNLSPEGPPSTSSSWGQDLENRLNTFGDVGFLLAQWTGWNWQNFKSFRCPTFSPCNYNGKIPAHVKLFTRMFTVNIFKLRQRFRKSVEYLWRYRIFSGTVYRLKVAKFQMLSMRKIFNLPLQK